MPPEPRLAIVATVQQAISSLLTTYEPEFLRFERHRREARAESIHGEVSAEMVRR